MVTAALAPSDRRKWLANSYLKIAVFLFCDLRLSIFLPEQTTSRLLSAPLARLGWKIYVLRGRNAFAIDRRGF